MTEHIKEQADPEAISWDGFDSAIIGTTQMGRLVYDINKMVNILVERDEMSPDEAFEYIDFNILNAYVGEMTPVHIYLAV